MHRSDVQQNYTLQSPEPVRIDRSPPMPSMMPESSPGPASESDTGRDSPIVKDSGFFQTLLSALPVPYPLS